jgi:hypothetical protein
MSSTLNTASQAPDVVITSAEGHEETAPTLPPRSPGHTAVSAANAHANTTNQGATSTATVAPTTATTAPSTTTTAAATVPQTTEDHLSFNEKLNAGDRYWKFKFGLMAILIITGLIGIGCFAWIVTTIPGGTNSYYGYDSFWALWPSFITFSVSIIWCLICMLIFVLRKRTVHPGVRVTMDLLLWLGFIVTALFSLVALRDLMDFGEYGGIDGYGYYSYNNDGDYVLAANNTWVWEQDSSYITYPRDCSSSSSSYSEFHFKDCAEQDAYINTLWHEKSHRTNVELTGVVCQFFGLVLHFALFVWACVDTHRYNRSKVSKDAEKLAAGIVQTMITNGAVVPPPGQAYMRPQMGQSTYYQLPPQQQGYPMQPTYMPQGPGQQQMYQQQRPGQQPQMAPGQYPTGQPGMPTPPVDAAGPSNEKGQGLRYA